MGGRQDTALDWCFGPSKTPGREELLSVFFTTSQILVGGGTEIRRTLLNLASVIGGEAALRVASLVAAVVIARNSGPALFGIYATALAYATITTLLADNGLQI